MSFEIQITETRDTNKNQVEWEKLYDTDAVPAGQQQYGYAESPRKESVTRKILELRVDEANADDLIAAILAVVQVQVKDKATFTPTTLKES